MTALLIVLAVVTVMLGAALNMLANWANPPRWLKPWHRVAGICVCIAILVVVAVVVVVREQDDNSQTPPSKRVRASTVEELAPQLAAARLITVDDSAGRPVLFASRLDGRNRVRLWDMPDSWPGAMVDDNTVVLSAVWEERDVERLEVFSSDGVFQRALTEPASDESDTSPSVAGDTVYFIRNSWKDYEGGRSLERSRLMSVPVAGGAVTEVAVDGAELRAVDAAPDGRLVAGTCVADGPSGGCVVDTHTGTVTRFGSEQAASMDEVAVSADGQYVAYSSPATNPYGQTQIYAYNLESGATTALSALPGMNGSPAWAPEGPCLVFDHYERTAGASVYLSCLTPDPVTVPAIPVGASPVWLPR
jgi:Tol biopolymer transport system component